MKISNAALTAFALSFLASVEADAHGWYSDRKDPVFGNPCCGGTDCGLLTVNSNVLTAEPGGYRIRLSLAETRRINPYSAAPIDALVPWDRIQRSEDGNFHICLMTYDRAHERGGVYCLFAPPNS
jgi:hypothetical protein